MAWVILFIAGLAETGWVVALKCSAGFTRAVPSAVTVVLMIGSLLLLSQAVKTLPVGTYAVWVGIGASGAFIIGMIAFDEPRDWLRIGAVALIIVGIVGLRLGETPPPEGEAPAPLASEPACESRSA